MDNQQISTWIREIDGGKTATLPDEKPKPLPPKPPLPPFERPPVPAYKAPPPPTRVRPHIGRPSTKYGYLGVWIVCLGPYGTELKGDRFNVVVFDRQGKIRRRLATVPRYKVAPASDGDPDVLVDFDENGEMDEIVYSDFDELCSNRQKYLSIIGQWCHKHGRAEYAF